MDTKKGPPIDQTPGLAGGPGPTPPGVEDGTPMPSAAAPETAPAPPSASAQRAQGEVAEREAGVRQADVPGARSRPAPSPGTRRAPGEREGAPPRPRGDPEEPDPS